jgi:hypothetical protein
MDPNQHVPALQVVVGADGRLYVAIPQAQGGNTVGAQAQATPPTIMQMPIQAPMPDFLRMVQSGQIPQQQQSAGGGAAPPNPLSGIPPFNPNNLMNSAALMNPSVLAALAGLLQPHPINDPTGGGGQQQQQHGLPQMSTTQLSNDSSGYSQPSSSTTESSNAWNNNSNHNSINNSSSASSNNFVTSTPMMSPSAPLPTMNTMASSGTPYPFFFDPSNPLVQQMPYAALSQNMGLVASHHPQLQQGLGALQQLGQVQVNANALPPTMRQQDGSANQQQLLVAAATGAATAPGGGQPPSSRNHLYEGVIPDRPPVLISMPFDAQSLSSYQCLVRQQIEIFQAVPADVEANAQGRNRPIVLGQVGIRCRHCAILPPKQRKSGAVYFPSKVRCGFGLVGWLVGWLVCSVDANARKVMRSGVLSSCFSHTVQCLVRVVIVLVVVRVARFLLAQRRLPDRSKHGRGTSLPQVCSCSRSGAPATVVFEREEILRRCRSEVLE